MENFSSDFKNDLSDLCLSGCQTLKIAFFCDVIPCNLVVGSQCCGGTSCCHLRSG